MSVECNVPSLRATLEKADAMIAAFPKGLVFSSETYRPNDGHAVEKDLHLPDQQSVKESPAKPAFLDAVDATIVDEFLKAHPLMDSVQWDMEPDEQPRPLIENLVERGSCVAIVGPSKSCKSWLTLDTAICLAAGRDWFGRKTTQQVVYVANIEVSSRTYKERYRSVRKRLGVDNASLRERLYIDNLRGQEVSFDLCLTRAKEAHAEVVIIDPFYRVFRGSEKDDAQCQEAVEEMNKFLKHGMTLIVVFHAPKGFSGDRQIVDMISGSSVLARFPDNVIAILPHATEKDARVVDCSVLRDYAPPDPFSVKMDDGALVLAPDIEPELKSGNRYKSFKSPEERNADKVANYKSEQGKIGAACLAFLERRGDNLPSAAEIRDELRKVGTKSNVDVYLKLAKDNRTLATTSEMVKDGNGGWKVKRRTDGGKTFISTPERIKAYCRTFESCHFKNS